MSDSAWPVSPRVLGFTLALSILAVFAQTLGFDFVNFDDHTYVTRNPHVRNGLTPEGLVWAFTASRSSNWHPLTWISHMLDATLFGLQPGGHHASSVLFHLLNSLLLLQILCALTGRPLRATLVAALFALHPLHVESVAWVSERKDVLSGFFALLTIRLYVRSARRGGKLDVRLLACCFAMGLMCKPMLVTLPLILLLLDFWPLDRLARIGGRRCITEKWPLFGMAVASSLATFFVQRAGGAVELGTIAIQDRLANAVVSYVRYVGKTLWPSDLAVLYTHPNLPGGTPWTQFELLGSALLLGAITTGVLLSRRRYLITGWLWFVVMLLPVIGLIQVGHQAMADRYTYLPLIGLFIAIVWGVAELVPLATGTHAALRRLAPVVASCVLLAACAVACWSQTRLWRDSITLFEHASNVSPTSPIVQNNLGVSLARAGRVEEALPHFERALRTDPDYAEARSNLDRAVSIGGGRPPS